MTKGGSSYSAMYVILPFSLNSSIAVSLTRFLTSLLFYQTVNTAARMESNGARNRIHCSKETATLLEAAGKSWACPREDLVRAKGKGELQTYWLEFAKKASTRGSTASSEDVSNMASEDHDDKKSVQAGLRSKAIRAANKENKLLDEKVQRLVDWNTDVLCRILKQVVGRNRALEKTTISKVRPAAASKDIVGRTVGTTVIDEVVEIIELPELNSLASRKLDSQEDIELDPAVVEQIRCYIHTIASMYRENPFHNFEHVRITLPDAG